MIIALTGGIACGKSTVCDFLARQGWQVLDSDDLVHDFLAEDGVLVEPIVDHFGERVLASNGSIDRAVLGRFVFEDVVERDYLNGLVHPLVRLSIVDWKAALAVDQHGVVEVPLLFEVGWEKDDWHAVVCVAASKDECIRRLKSRGCSEAEALQRIEAQWPLDEKMKRSDYVIYNDGDFKHLDEEMNTLTHALHGLE